MREVVKRPQAMIDLILIAEYLEVEAELRVAARFLEAAENAFEKLAFMPGMGVARTYGSITMQMWPIPKFTNYLIFYITTDTTLEVIRVMHGARNLEDIFDPSETTDAE